MQGQRSSAEISTSIDQLQARYGAAVPSREQLADIARTYSVDFAALFLTCQLMESRCNRQINQDFQRMVADNKAAPLDTTDFLVLFMPGWDYVENGSITGADFAQPQKLMTGLGVENYLVPLPPTGGVEENARVLVQTLAQHARSGKRILIAGASSSGPAIHLALAEMTPPDTLRSVHAWLNLGGILQGSPLVDFLQEVPQRWIFDLVVWFKGWNTVAIDSMSARVSRTRFHRLSLDSKIMVVNYLGVPLSGQLSKFSRDKYPLLKPEGPNDGLTLLADALAPNSLTIVALGSDHFFAEDPAINHKTQALMSLIATYLNKANSAGGVNCVAQL